MGLQRLQVLTLVVVLLVCTFTTMYSPNGLQQMDSGVLSAQFYAAALKSHPDILHEIGSGEFGTLHTWLRDNLYRHGSKFAPNDLVERATGAVMQMTPYLDYLYAKYGALYRLPVGSDRTLTAQDVYDVGF